jgi:hypothetical protein
MRMLTYDGQSFLLGGRRIWLVGGTIDYARVPRAHWRERLLAAKQAGLNCIATTCLWSLHEPRSGRFRFEDNLDVAGFLDLCRELELLCILRVGPYVGNDYDLGGMPPWVAALPDVKLRTDDPAFLEPVSRYFQALLRPLASYQAMLEDNQPLVLIQCEDSYFYDDDEMAESYLGALARYVRESGISVPIVGSHNLWNSVEGQVDGWVGRDALLGTMRQLHAVRPGTPRLVIELKTGNADFWGRPKAKPLAGDELLHDMAQALAGGGQFNLMPFHGGTNYGFIGGRRAAGEQEDGYVTATYDCGAPLSECGAKGENYGPVKRLATFASSFGRIFAALDPQSLSAVVDPTLYVDDDLPAAKRPTDPAVVHAVGGQGSIVFVFGAIQKGRKNVRRDTTVLLPSGVSLPVTLPDQSVAWCLCNVRIAGRARLDYTNLCAFTAFGSVLVLFGAPGSEGIVAINENEATFTVPKGKTPLITEHEDVTLVICNPDLIDATCLMGSTLYVGIEGFDEEDEPIPHRKFKTVHVIRANGATTKETLEAATRRQSTTLLKDWQGASQRELVTGEYPRFAAINGPASLTKCGAPHGYGYYMIDFKSAATGKNVFVPRGGDRLSLYIDGELKTILGDGPGTSGRRYDAGLKKASRIVVVADNLGRYSEMERIGDDKGVIDHLYEVAPVKLNQPRKVEAEGVDPTELVKPLFFGRVGELTDWHHLVWKVTHRKKSNLLITAEACDRSFVLIINDQPVAVHADHNADSLFSYRADESVLKRGVNQIAFAPFEDLEEVADDLTKCVKIHEITSELSADARWSFAKWQKPAAAAYERLTPSALKSYAGAPAWYRCTFQARHKNQPHWLDIGKLSKGQIFLNGHNICRYFAATHEGKLVPPQRLYYLPSGIFNESGENELVIYDEHGCPPTSCKIVAADTPPRGA